MLGPYAVAALVLCVAAVGKLRTPRDAAQALAAAGLPISSQLIRVLAAGELALGIVAILAPSRLTAAGLALAYGGFAMLALVLSRRGAACGCFGAAHATASPLQAVISAALALACAGAACGRTHGVTWILERSPMIATSLILGISAAVFATVVAYSELPSAWNAWSGR